MTLKLVGIDMDETLLRKDKSYEQERFDEVVNALVDQGVTVVIASVNDVNKIKSYLSDNTLSKIYLAGDNGNDVEYAGEHIHTNFIDFEALEKVSDLVDSDDDLQMVVNSPENAYSKYIYEKDKDFIDLFYEEINIIDSYADMPEGEYPIKGAILSSKELEETKEVVKKINHTIEGLASVTTGEGWFDVYNSEGGKGAAIEWLQGVKGVTPEETIAFGDSLNDGGMMDFADYSVAMSNADEDLKAICNYEIGSNEDQAVIDILEKFVETGNMDFMEDYKK
jgi:hypothetical protein